MNVLRLLALLVTYLLVTCTRGGGILSIPSDDSRESSQNPIAASYPTSITGTFNGTIVVVPVPLEFARSIVPTQHLILKNAYQSLLPSFPVDKYPVSSSFLFISEGSELTSDQIIVRAIVDHDIRLLGLQGVTSDFQVSLDRIHSQLNKQLTSL